MKVGQLELQILKELRQDGRISYRKLAQKLGVATGTIQTKVDKMIKEGIIHGIRASLNYEKLGYGVTAIIGVNIPDRRILKKVEEKLLAHKNVFNLYEVTGGYDVVLTTRFKSMNDFSKFVTQGMAIEGIGNSTTFLVLNTKKEKFTLLS